MCFLASPDPTCRRTQLGTEYIGNKSTTVSGKECLLWSANLTLRHFRDKHLFFPEVDHSQARNYCRNPDSRASGPWCFTWNSAAEPCDIHMCGRCYYCIMKLLLHIYTQQTQNICAMSTKYLTRYL